MSVINQMLNGLEQRGVHLEAEQVQLILTVKGVDETSSQELRTRKLYAARDLLRGRVYADILSTGSDGITVLDYGKFNETKPE